MVEKSKHNTCDITKKGYGYTDSGCFLPYADIHEAFLRTQISAISTRSISVLEILRYLRWSRMVPERPPHFLCGQYFVSPAFEPFRIFGCPFKLA